MGPIREGGIYGQGFCDNGQGTFTHLHIYTFTHGTFLLWTFPYRGHFLRRRFLKGTFLVGEDLKRFLTRDIT